MKLCLSMFRIFAAISITLTHNTKAALAIRITAGTTTFTTLDNSPADDSVEIGSLAFHVPSGTFAGWTGLAVAAISKPIIGTDTAPQLEFTWQAVRRGGTNLHIEITDTGFFVSWPRSLTLSSGGTLGTSSSNSAWIQAYSANDNLEFNKNNFLTQHVFNGPGYFAGNDPGWIGGAPLSLTLAIELNHSLGQSSGGKVHLHSVPSPPVAPKIYDIRTLTNGQGVQSFEFYFTNISGHRFWVLSSTNVATPLTNWSVLEEAWESFPGHYQFQRALGESNSFFKLRTP